MLPKLSDPQILDRLQSKMLMVCPFTLSQDDISSFYPATSHKHTFGKSYDVLSGPSVCSELYPQTPITDAQYF